MDLHGFGVVPARLDVDGLTSEDSRFTVGAAVEVDDAAECVSGEGVRSEPGVVPGGGDPQHADGIREPGQHGDPSVDADRGLGLPGNGDGGGGLAAYRLVSGRGVADAGAAGGRKFGQIFDRPVQGQVYAQPLVANGTLSQCVPRSSAANAAPLFTVARGLVLGPLQRAAPLAA